jgi:uncharacterized protein
LSALKGLPLWTNGHKIFGAATTPELLEKIRDKVEISQIGTISGISASVMSECLLHGIPALSFLGATMNENPDSRAASSVIEILNELYGFLVNTQGLIEQAESIEIELLRLAGVIQTTEQKKEVKKELPMYM